MICPQCQTPNPDYAADCLECSHSLSGDHLTIVSPSPAGEMTSVPTMGSPSSFKEWASRSQQGPASAVLPAGLEIGARYRVKSLLGMGGMGAVYLVHDQGLDRDVALKLIRTDIAEDADILARFKREIQLSSRVTHPNVLRVFDLGEADGVKFLTMQFVEGRDLSTILKKQGKLPTERLLRVFRQTAEGLKAAHDQGVIHRDLKPQNIMLDASDRVYVTDFGLAKSAEQSGMTQTGAVIGTPFYMSPEQVRGEQVGPQSDIYALGIILYQMLAGAVPFSGSTPYEVMMARILQPPRPVKELNPETPAYLQKIVERCLAVDRKLRYQRVDEILKDMDAEAFHSTLRYEALRRSWVKPAIAAGTIAAVLAGGGLWIYRSGRAARSATAGAQKVQSVLIADFENKTGDPIFDGTLESSFGLAMEGASFVSNYNRGQARKIAVQLQPGSTGLTEALGRLVAVREGVHVVTAGAIEKDGDGYKISVRAVDAATGKPIASQSLSAATKEEVLSTIAKLAGRVRQGMGDATPMSLQVAAAETFTAGSLEASHEYAEAQDDQYAGKYDDAAKHYLKAVELDPELGRADAGLGVIYSNQGRRDEAEKYYKLAIAHIDRMSDREKYRTRGGYYLIVRRDPDKAIEEYGQLVQRYPADTAGIANLALAYFYKRDMARALSEGIKAVAIYPKNVPQRNNVGLYAMYAGDFATAIREQKKVIEMNPKFVLGYVGARPLATGRGPPARGRCDLPEGRPRQRARHFGGCHGARRRRSLSGQARGGDSDSREGRRSGPRRQGRRFGRRQAGGARRGGASARGQGVRGRRRGSRHVVEQGRERPLPRRPRLPRDRPGAEGARSRQRPVRASRSRSASVRGAHPGRGGVEARQAPRGDTDLRSGPEDLRHLAGPVRPGEGVHRNGRLPGGPRPARDGLQTPRRGDGDVPRRVADVPRLPAGLLLPRARPGGRQEPRSGRVFQGLPRHQGKRRRGSARRGRPAAPRIALAALRS